MDFQIKIVNKVIRIDSIYEFVLQMCKSYLVEESHSDVFIKVTEEDIIFEDTLSNQERLAQGKVQCHFSPDYLESLAVYRKIAESLLQFDTILTHGAVLGTGKGAVMFTAKSGTGKTTCVGAVLNKYPYTYVINGDKPLIHFDNGEDSYRIHVYGTPWCGKEGLNSNTDEELKSICILERGTENVLEEIRFSAAFPYLVHQTYKPSTSKQIIRTLELLGKLSGRVKLFRLQLKYYEKIEQLDNTELSDIFLKILSM